MHTRELKIDLEPWSLFRVLASKERPFLIDAGQPWGEEWVSSMGFRPRMQLRVTAADPADAPLDRFAGDQLQQELQDVEAISRHALAHATVVEFFFRRTSVIPLKLFTLFSSDEAARAQFRGRLGRLRRLLSSLRGKEEWGVRIIAGDVVRESARTLPSGRDYLQVKKRLLDETAEPPSTVVRAVNGALRSLGTVAAKTRKVSFPPAGKGRPYVAGASFLVPATKRSAWKAHIARTTAALAGGGHRLELSGPWPPYTFSNIELEFKTRFGVS